MKLNDLVKQTSEWLKGTGPNSDIVISSRIRLARNLNNYPFSQKATTKQKRDALKDCKAAIAKNNFLKSGLFLNLQDLTNLDKQFLLERHMVSKELLIGADNKAVAISDREIISIMINEEDHLRIQVIQSGLNLAQTWDVIDMIDSELGTTLNYAYSGDFGYLTACPTNTGTGMRASVMLHLPALVITKQINRVIQAISKLNLTARGLYGEGTQASGNFFQISNQITMGHLETEVVDNLTRVIKQIITHEQNARKQLIASNKTELEDRIYRAYGTLKNAHIISSNETVELLSMVRMGVDMEMVKDLSIDAINQLFISIQPAHLQKMEGKALSAQQRDAKRAELIRSKLQ